MIPIDRRTRAIAIAARRKRAATTGRLRGFRVWDRYQLCQFAEVLGGGGEEELIARAGRSAEPQPVEREDALEVGERNKWSAGTYRSSETHRTTQPVRLADALS